jgi:hypothetical protein
VSTVGLVLDTSLAASLDCERSSTSRLDGGAYVVDRFRAVTGALSIGARGERRSQMNFREAIAVIVEFDELRRGGAAS